MIPMNKYNNSSQNTGQTSYSRPDNTKLPENYTLRDGYICKGGMPAALVTPGIVEAAAHGFLHVEETEEYRTG